MNWISKPRPRHPARVWTALGAGPCVLALLLLGFALPSHADNFWDLVACNTSNVEIDTVNVNPDADNHN